MGRRKEGGQKVEGLFLRCQDLPGGQRRFGAVTVKLVKEEKDDGPLVGAAL